MKRKFWRSVSFSMTETEVQNDPDLIVSVIVDVCQPVMVVFCLVCFPHNMHSWTRGTVFISLASRDFEKFIIADILT